MKAEAKACVRWIPSLRRHDPDQVLRVSASSRLSVHGWQGTAGADAPSDGTPPGTDVIIGMAVMEERAGIMVIPNVVGSGCGNADGASGRMAQTLGTTGEYPTMLIRRPSGKRHS